MIPASIPKGESSRTMARRIPSRRLLSEFPRRGCPCWRRTTPFRARMGVVPVEGVSVTGTAYRRDREETVPDAIATLHERIRREQGKREAAPAAPAMGLEEAEKYIQMVKQQQQRGLRKLKGEKGDDNSGYGYRVDPYTLRPGDYVVHKKVGIGRFVGIKYDVSRDSTEPIEYAFIEYGDGMAKLPVNKAKKMLYRYNL